MKSIARRSLILIVLLAGILAYGMEMKEMKANASEVYGVPTTEERLSYTPSSFRQDMAQSKGLGDGEQLNEEHWALQAVYQAVFFETLSAEYPLRRLDEELAHSEMRLIPVPLEDRAVYQKYNAHGMSFFFLRGHFHIERLADEDLQLLREARYADAPSEALAGMVRRTYADVIRIDYDGSGEQFEAVYAMDAFGDRRAPNDALVLGLATAPEYDEAGNLASVENEQLKSAFLEAYAQRVETEMAAILGIPVRIFLYFG